MKLSTRGRYGTRLMLDLATHFGEGPILLKDISARQKISEKYLWQLISPLKNAGLINSTRGANGGYELSRQPKTITLCDIMAVLEGPMYLVECVDNSKNCELSFDCVTRDIWKEISDKVLYNNGLSPILSVKFKIFLCQGEKHRYSMI